MSGSAPAAMRSFFVDILYRTNRESENHFLNSIEHATKEVAELYAAVESAAGGILAFTMKIAAGMERMYYASQRTGSGVQAMNAFSYAISQVGGTAAGAQQSLEGIAAFLRSTPAGEGFFHGLGIATRDANNQFIGTEKIAEQFAKKVTAWGPARAQAYANMVGIDNQTLLAMRNNFGPYMAEYDDMVQKAGLNSQQAAKDGAEFTRSVRSLGSAFSVLELKVASTLESRLGKQIRAFRDLIVANFGNISNVIEKGAAILLKLAEVMGVVATRTVSAIRAIVEWFERLNPATRRVLQDVTLLVAAWYLLNRSFLASPIGVVVALVAAIGLLIDDYNTWKSGGKSLIDWSQWEPGIVAVMGAIKMIGGWLGELAKHTTATHLVLEAFGLMIAGRWLSNLTKGFGGAGSLITGFRQNLLILAGLAGWEVGKALEHLDQAPTGNSEFAIAMRNAQHMLGTDQTAGGDHSIMGNLTNWGLRKLGLLPPGAAELGSGQKSKLGVVPGATGAMQYLMQTQGMTLNQASAMIAAAIPESGLDIHNQGDWDPKTATYAAYGMFQDHKDRRDLIEAHLDQVRGSHVPYEQLDAEGQMAGQAWEWRQGQERNHQDFATQQDPATAALMYRHFVIRPHEDNPVGENKYGDADRVSANLAPLLQKAYLDQHRPLTYGAAGAAVAGGATVNTNTTIHVQAPPGNDPHSFANVIGKLNDQQNQTTLRNVANKTQ